MYAGQLVETAPAREIFRAPQHPYSRALLAATVDPFGPPVDPTTIVRGDAVTSPAAIGCSFAPRCPFALDACRTADAVLVEIGPGRASACIRHDELFRG
jgi:oligopeptide/dipeptide ABC transporter ATP-binding protein